jgi:IgGFc binding protein
MGARDATARAHVAQRETRAVAQRSNVHATVVAQPARFQSRVRGVAGTPLLAAFVAVAVVNGAACRAGSAPIDGGDAGPAPDTTPKLCATQTACEATRVHACRDGRFAEVIEECGPERTCSRGRCTSLACADAERNPGAILGCSFYTLHLDNVASDDLLPASVLVTNPGQVPANATLQHRLGGQWTDLTKAVVSPMQSVRLALPVGHFEGGGPAAQSALRLVTDLPVTVAHVQSDDTGSAPSRSSAATLLLPEHVLGRRYRAIAYPQLATAQVVLDVSQRQGAGQLVIIGTQDRTSVTVKPPVDVVLGPAGGAPPAGTNGAFKLVLDEGDYEQIYTSRDGDDLTGTEIVADRPVAVFSGNIATTYGQMGVGINSGDLAHEQLLPVASWSSSFVAASLPPKVGVCDSLYDTGPTSIWRIVADEANTQIQFQAAKNVMGPFAPRTLGAGERLRLFVPAGVSFSVKASAPIEIMQGTDCEATLSSAVPAGPWLTDLWFATLPTYDTALAVVRRMGQSVVLDDARLADALFVPAGMGFEVGQIPLDACPAAQGVCTHHLSGQFGVTMRGQDVLTSWALTVPTWRPCLDPDVSTCSN